MREPRSGFLSQCFPSQALPAPHSGDHNYLGRGMGVEEKPPSVVFPPLASPRVISLQQRARVLLGIRFASTDPRGGALDRACIGIREDNHWAAFS